MVLDGFSIEVGTIIAYGSGVGSKIIFDQYARWRDRREEAKQTRIQWYEDVSSLAKEIKLVVPYLRRNTEYFNKEMNLGEKSLSEVLSDEDMKMVREEYEEQGFDEEEAEVRMEQVAYNSWEEKRKSVQKTVEMDMKMYEQRLRELFSQYPDDVDEELIEDLGTLLWRLNAVGTIGRFYDERRVEPVVESIISRCDDSLDKIE